MRSSSHGRAIRRAADGHLPRSGPSELGVCQVEAPSGRRGNGCPLCLAPALNDIVGVLTKRVVADAVIDSYED